MLPNFLFMLIVFVKANQKNIEHKWRRRQQNLNNNVFYHFLSSLSISMPKVSFLKFNFSSLLFVFKVNHLKCRAKIPQNFSVVYFVHQNFEMHGLFYRFISFS